MNLSEKVERFIDSYIETGLSSANGALWDLLTEAVADELRVCADIIEKVGPGTTLKGIADTLRIRAARYPNIEASP